MLTPGGGKRRDPGNKVGFPAHSVLSFVLFMDYLGVRTCELFLCFVLFILLSSIVLIGCSHIVFFVLSHP